MDIFQPSAPPKNTEPVNYATQAEVEAQTEEKKIVSPKGLGFFLLWLQTQIVTFRGLVMGRDTEPGSTRTIESRGSAADVDIEIKPKGNGKTRFPALAGQGFKELAVDNSGNLIYASVLPVSFLVIKNVAVNQPSAITFDSDAGVYYVADYGARQTLQKSLLTDATINTFQHASSTTYLVDSPEYIYIFQDNFIERIAKNTGVISQFATPNGSCAGGDYDLATGRLFVALRFSGQVEVYDTNTGSLLTTINVGVGLCDDVKIDRANLSLMVVHRQQESIKIYDLTTYQLRQVIAAGSGCIYLHIDETANRYFVSYAGISTIKVFNLSTHQEIIAADYFGLQAVNIYQTFYMNRFRYYIADYYANNIRILIEK